MTELKYPARWQAGTYKTEDLRQRVQDLVEFLQQRAAAHVAGGRLPFAEEHHEFAVVLDLWLKTTDSGMAAARGSVSAYEAAWKAVCKCSFTPPAPESGCGKLGE